MILPNNCPICSVRMITEHHESLYSDLQRVVKICKVDNHLLKLFSLINQDEVYQIILQLSGIDENVMYVKWLYDAHQVRIETVPYDKIFSSSSTDYKIIRLPWFEPDFNNYNKLFEKLKTYVLFS